MKKPEKTLDRKFLAFLYDERINDNADLYENFVKHIPKEILRINILLNNNHLLKAVQLIKSLVNELNNIGLPCMAVQLQIVEVYINFCKVATAKSLFKTFENELMEYMPAILNECSRQKAYKHFIRIQPTRTLAI
jgi:hypothetical protein